VLRILNAANAVAQNAVTLARHLLEALRINDTDLTAAEFDESCALKKADSDGHSRSSGPQQPGYDIMREQQHITVDRISRYEKPAANPFLKRVVTVANTRLGDLNQKGVRILQQ
jgi:hypothetical protein